jgi:hypothetical protein
MNISGIVGKMCCWRRNVNKNDNKIWCNSRIHSWARGYTMPKSETTVANLIISFYDIKKQELCDKISVMKNSGAKFSITVDEWTDIAMNRYLNFTLQNQISYWLGLFKINGSCDAFLTRSLDKPKLADFELGVTVIIASTHDAADLLPKFESWKCNRFCFIQIIILFYRKIQNNINITLTQQ